MAVQAVLFDLDGTLLDSLADIGEAMNSVLKTRGLPGHSACAYRRFVGDGVVLLAQRALPADHRDPDTVSACAAQMREVYGRRLVGKTVPYDGVPELLDGLSRRGLRMGVLSNKPHALTVELVELLLGRWRFAPVFGERAAVPRKPDPAGALEVAVQWGIAPEAVLYVGDTSTDMQTAERAGMPSVGVTWGFRDEPELTAAGAKAIARHPNEILALLG